MAISGLARTYDQSTVLKEDLESVISLISPTEAPLFSLLNRVPVINYTHYWVEDALRGMTSKLAAAATGSIGATKIYLQSGHGAARFPASASKPILIRVGEEIMLGTSRTTDCLTVTRDYNTSGTAAHASMATVHIIADLTLEGADARAALAQSRTKPYNVTQVFEKTVNISGSMQAMDVAGVMSSEADYQAQQQMLNIKIELERSLITGTRVVGTDSTFRSMGGIWYYISTNKFNAASAELTEAMIETDAQACFDAGGNPSILMCNSIQARKITALYKNRIRSEPEKVLGGAQITRITMPIAGSQELAILVNRWVPQHEYYMLDGSKLGLGVLRPFALKDLAITGDALKQQVVGEYTLVIKNETAHARRYALSVA